MVYIRPKNRHMDKHYSACPYLWTIQIVHSSHFWHSFVERVVVIRETKKDGAAAMKDERHREDSTKKQETRSAQQSSRALCVVAYVFITTHSLFVGRTNSPSDQSHQSLLALCQPHRFILATLHY